jgi:hypothetical protein
VSNPKGGRFEKELLDYIRSMGYDVERLRLSGAQDEGDLLVRTRHSRFVFEAKNRAKMDLAGWVEEARVESENYLKHRDLDGFVGYAVIHKRRGKGPGGAYVTLPLSEYLEQIR